MVISGKHIVRVLVRHRVALIAYIRSIVRDDVLAEDVFQDVCVLAYQKHEEIRDEGHLLGWLRVAARYESLKALRSRANSPLLFDTSLLDLLDDQWKLVDQAQTTTRSQALHRCLGKLTDNARHIIQLRYGESMSGQKLADALDRKLNTVYVALSRIHRTLAECMGHQLREEPFDA